MGQYYMIVNVDTKAYVHPSTCPNQSGGIWFTSLKRMGHSYLGSHVVRSVESLLVEGGKWNKASLVWAGDYADPEPGHSIVEEEGGEPVTANLYRLCVASTLGTMEEGLKPKEEHYRYIVNHSSNQFVDIVKVPDDGIHPLPLLTVEGNGFGGGDYRGDLPYDGLWARDKMSVQNVKPNGDFQEFKLYDYYGWDTVGHLMLLRELCNQGRANQVTGETDTKATRVLSKVMMDLNESTFSSCFVFHALTFCISSRDAYKGAGVALGKGLRKPLC